MLKAKDLIYLLQSRCTPDQEIVFSVIKANKDGSLTEVFTETTDFDFNNIYIVEDGFYKSLACIIVPNNDGLRTYKSGKVEIRTKNKLMEEKDV